MVTGFVVKGGLCGLKVVSLNPDTRRIIFDICSKWSFIYRFFLISKRPFYANKLEINFLKQRFWSKNLYGCGYILGHYLDKWLLLIPTSGLTAPQSQFPPSNFWPGIIDLFYLFCPPPRSGNCYEVANIQCDKKKVAKCP